jgi:hypothetical protein
MDQDRLQSTTSSSAGFTAATTTIASPDSNISPHLPAETVHNISSVNTTTTELVTELRGLVDEIKSLRHRLTRARTRNQQHNSTSDTQKNQRDNTHSPEHQPTSKKQRQSPPSYCWTHGYTRNRSHTSHSCQQRAPGHQSSATCNNRQGGSEVHWRNLNN